MRKVGLYTLMSLDGEVDDPSRYFTPFDSAMEENEAKITGTQDAVLLGRNTYDEWSGYWPTVPGEPFAQFINRVKKYVVTSRPLSRGWNNSERVEGRAEDAVRRLKDQPGGDIGVHGSIQLARSLLAAGLIDELRLVVGPAFGFSGRRLFPSAGDIRRLELISAAPTPSGGLLLGYRVP